MMKNITRYFFFGERKVFHFVNNTIKCRILDWIMPYITRLGGAIFTIVFPIILIAFGKAKIRLIGIETFATLFLSHILVQVIKRFVSRARPYDILKNINTFNIKLEDYSFPSGHTTASFSIATILSLNVPYLMFLLMGIATLVGVSRVYLGVHYPSDVIVGVILGSTTSILIHPYFLVYLI